MQLENDQFTTLDTLLTVKCFNNEFYAFIFQL